MNIQFATYQATSKEHNRFEQFVSEVSQNNQLENWTATSKFKIGDVVLFYFGVPHKSIIAIGIVASEPEEIYDEFDWTQKEKEYFCNFEPVWLLKNPLNFPSQNILLDSWYSKKPYRSSRILENKIATPILMEILKHNPEIQNYKELQRKLSILTIDNFSKDENKIDNLSTKDYVRAFQSLKDVISEIDLKMLKANLEAPHQTVTATQLSNIMDFSNFNAANLRYGTFARKLCDFFKVKPAQFLYVLVYFKKINDEWHWTLRENVVAAIIELNLFENATIPNIVNEIEVFKNDQKSVEITTKEAIIQSRIGQGLFRVSLIEYWQGCSVTGCQLFEILKASHIKPWRYSNNSERLNLFNGLLLMPNLDSLFDCGLISFDEKGKILISKLLNRKYLKIMGINDSMSLRKIENDHKIFLQYHRTSIFKSNSKWSLING